MLVRCSIFSSNTINKAGQVAVAGKRSKGRSRSAKLDGYWLDARYSVMDCRPIAIAPVLTANMHEHVAHRGWGGSDQGQTGRIVRTGVLNIIFAIYKHFYTVGTTYPRCNYPFVNR